MEMKDIGYLKPGALVRITAANVDLNDLAVPFTAIICGFQNKNDGTAAIAVMPNFTPELLEAAGQSPDTELDDSIMFTTINIPEDLGEFELLHENIWKIVENVESLMHNLLVKAEATHVAETVAISEFDRISGEVRTCIGNVLSVDAEEITDALLLEDITVDEVDVAAVFEELEGYFGIDFSNTVITEALKSVGEIVAYIRKTLAEQDANDDAADMSDNSDLDELDEVVTQDEDEDPLDVAKADL
jgi:hypothetical protein